MGFCWKLSRFRLSNVSIQRSTCIFLFFDSGLLNCWRMSVCRDYEISTSVSKILYIRYLYIFHYQVLSVQTRVWANYWETSLFLIKVDQNRDYFLFFVTNNKILFLKMPLPVKSYSLKKKIQFRCTSKIDAIYLHLVNILVIN